VAHRFAAGGAYHRVPPAPWWIWRNNASMKWLSQGAFISMVRSAAFQGVCAGLRRPPVRGKGRLHDCSDAAWGSGRSVRQPSRRRRHVLTVREVDSAPAGCRLTVACKPRADCGRASMAPPLVIIESIRARRGLGRLDARHQSGPPGPRHGPVREPMSRPSGARAASGWNLYRAMPAIFAAMGSGATNIRGAATPVAPFAPPAWRSSGTVPSRQCTINPGAPDRQCWAPISVRWRSCASAMAIWGGKRGGARRRELWPAEQAV